MKRSTLPQHWKSLKRAQRSLFHNGHKRTLSRVTTVAGQSCRANALTSGTTLNGLAIALSLCHNKFTRGQLIPLLTLTRQFCPSFSYSRILRLPFEEGVCCAPLDTCGTCRDRKCAIPKPAACVSSENSQPTIEVVSSRGSPLFDDERFRL